MRISIRNVVEIKRERTRGRRRAFCPRISTFRSPTEGAFARTSTTVAENKKKQKTTFMTVAEKKRQHSRHMLKTKKRPRQLLKTEIKIEMIV